MKRILLAGAMGLFLFSTAADVSAASSTHTVQKGDTLYRIAQTYKVSISELKQWNSLKSDSIYINQSLKTSAGSKTTGKPTPPAAAKASKTVLPAQTVTSNSTIYRVQKGDSLYGISKKFNVTVPELTAWNQLKTTTIYVNQSLKINKVSSEAATIPVQAAATVKQPVPAAAPLANNAAPVSKAAASRYDSVIDSAHAVVGTPYLFGGVSSAGFDCSGFIYYAYSQAGISIYRNSSAGYYSQSSSVTNPVAGDLVFFKDTYKPGISHMGIVVGNNSFIHAGSKGVEITRLDSPYWQQRFAGFRRLNTVSIEN
ncbi:LysM peptidoglycan-binding domain-containing protein [Planococcus salinus]|uniref:Peptidoglycan endopeptidase n=1 Tax=Planococcus salinus TaxID=1848460 RepID=A0A3M8P8Q7_9BACL|nr:C40 family peptidase [Planococcus salinus]RNF39992.1 peptidoglycan endopeptidase [Planococcus salinus]